MSQRSLEAHLPEGVAAWLTGRRIDEVECVVPDIAGTARGKAMPATKFERSDAMYLPTSIFYQTITGEYVDLEDLRDQWTESDLVLTPDMNTVTTIPWSGDVALQVVHDVQWQSGEPAPMAPRSVLRRVLNQYAEHGWTPQVAPELEFYLTKPNPDPDYPIEPPIGRTGRQGVARQAYSMSAVEEHSQIIDDIYDYAEAQGLVIDTLIHESGAGQIEINLQYGNPLYLADQVFYFKRLIREAALKNGCFATFMAKPMQHQPGSAMHIHQSVIDEATGRNLFTATDDTPSPAFYHFIAGLQNHIPSAICVLAPYVNSYRRFVRDDAAPINLEWGVDNRTTGLRIPVSGPAGRRIENRVVGMDCNPYLAIAASLACGLLGLREAQQPRPSHTGDAYELPHAIPRSLHEALDLFQPGIPIEALLGEEFCQIYRAIKQAEVAAFQQVISPWEREHLMLSV